MSKKGKKTKKKVEIRDADSGSAETESPLEADVAEADVDVLQESAAIKAEESPLDALQRERDDLFARLQRISADYQNTMKRSLTQQQEAVQLARGDLLKSLVPVLDIFDQALTQEPQSDEGRALFDGMRMVHDELLRVMGEAGVEKIDPEAGQAFDPHLHQAMCRQPAEGIAPNHVAVSLSPGYVHNGRTLRAAQVAVAAEPIQQEEQG
ncbi:MAG: nucleotide exchange factor GrpE [Phycisphaerae bacterium]|nr:nucleotide exchange factor GrpE [Phycisphaerae bacterium]